MCRRIEFYFKRYTFSVFKESDRVFCIEITKVCLIIPVCQPCTLNNNYVAVQGLYYNSIIQFYFENTFSVFKESDHVFCIEIRKVCLIIPVCQPCTLSNNYVAVEGLYYNSIIQFYFENTFSIYKESDHVFCITYSC